MPFKAASPMKKATGAQAGSYYGTLGGRISYEPVSLGCAGQALLLCSGMRKTSTHSHA